MPQSVNLEHITITQKTLAKQGIPGQIKEKQNYDKSIIHLPRQDKRVDCILPQRGQYRGKLRHIKRHDTTVLLRIMILIKSSVNNDYAGKNFG